MALRSTRHVHAIVLAMLLPSAGCLTDLGECDQVAAHRLVFRDDGTDVEPRNGHPMYAGQAILVKSCGNGQFCHSEDAHGADRYGVPHRLNFDLDLVCTDGPCLPFDPNLDPLRRGQSDALAYARHILRAVRYGSMPPGDIGAEIASRGADFNFVEYVPGSTYTLRSLLAPCDQIPNPARCDTDTNLGPLLDWPSLDEATDSERNEMLRNWLACGAPVVESTGDPGALATGGDCSIPGEVGHTGDCVVRVPAPIDPPAPYFECIYDRVLSASVCGNCHDASDSVHYEKSHLEFDTLASAYAGLVGSASEPSFSRGESCEADGQQLVIPHDSANSLLMLKLLGPDDAVCGDAMPTGTSAIDGRVIAAIAEWIDAGALNDSDPRTDPEVHCDHDP